MGELLDNHVDAAKKTFLAASETPSLEVMDDGRLVTGFSNTIETSRIVVEGLTKEEQLAILDELLETDQTFDFEDPVNIFDRGEKTPGDVIRSLISHIVSERMLLFPEVILREESNMKQHDLLLGYDDEEL